MGHPVRAESPKVGQEIRIPARTGVGLRVAGGEYVQDVEGRGCADLFALAAENLAEHLSGLAHPVQIDRLFPPVGQWFVRASGDPCCSSRRTTRRTCTTCRSRRAIPPGLASITSPDTRRAPRTSTPRSGRSGCGVPSPPSR
jgi:uncharacterized protein YcgI (DUF1989 family)